MEKQEEPVSAGEKIEDVKKKAQSFMEMLREFFSIVPDTLTAARRVIYPNWLSSMNRVTQAVIILIILGGIGGTAFYAWTLFVKYLAPAIGALLLVALVWVAWFHTEIPTKIWHIICWPFVKLKNLFFGSLLRTALTVIALIPIIVMIWVGRGVYHPLLSGATEHLANIIAMANLILFTVFWLTKKKMWMIVNISVFVIIQATGTVDVMSYNKRLSDLDIVTIDRKPLTPLLYWNAAETVDNQLLGNAGNNETISPSDLVIRSDGYLGYTAGITPRSLVTRVFNPLEKGGIIEVSTEPKVKNKVIDDVRVPIEKTLWLGRDSDKAIAKRFGFFEYFTSKIGNTIRLIDEKGDYYIITQVDRLQGFPNAYYAPNGVYITKEGDDKPRWKYWLFGAGKHIPLDEIKDYPFLKGQALTSERSLEQLGNSGKFIEGYPNNFVAGYWDAYVKRANGIVPNVLNGKILHNIVYVDEKLGGENYTGLVAEFQMVSFKKKRNLNRTWIFPLSGNKDKVYQYLNFEQQDFRVAPSILVPSILDGLPDRSMNEDNYRLVDIHSVKIDVEGEVVEAYMSTVEKLASKEEVRGKDLKMNEIITVLDAKHLPHSVRNNPLKTVPEQIEEMHRALFQL